MERSFAQDVKQLGYGAGQVLQGEGILAITKAVLQSGVSYVGGYPGAPVSHLLDVMAIRGRTLSLHTIDPRMWAARMRMLNSTGS